MLCRGQHVTFCWVLAATAIIWYPPPSQQGKCPAFSQPPTRVFLPFHACSEKYWDYEYEEVISPNIYNFDLWRTSGHADHYKENMFYFEIEKAEFGLKPMNCPGAVG